MTDDAKAREAAARAALGEARVFCRDNGLGYRDDVAVAQLLVLIEIRNDLAKLAHPPMMVVPEVTDLRPGRVTYVE